MEYAIVMSFQFANKHLFVMLECFHTFGYGGV